MILIIPIYLINNDLVELTNNCLNSLIDNQPERVMIVDDGSTLPYGDNVFTTTLKAEMHRLDKNYGYTRAVNEGIKKCDDEIIIIGNNDLKFSEGWLEAIIGPLEFADIVSLPTSEPAHYVTPRNDIVENEKFGSIFAIKRKVFDEVGLFDEGLGRGYFSDIDFHLRAYSEGFKIVKNYNVVLPHSTKSTFKMVDPNDLSYKYSAEQFLKKWGTLDDSKLFSELRDKRVEPVVKKTGR